MLCLFQKNVSIIFDQNWSKIVVFGFLRAGNWTFVALVQQVSAKTLFQARDFCSWSLSASVSQKPLSVPSKNSSFKLDVLKINHWLALRCFLNCSRLDFCRLPGTYTWWMHRTHTATPQTATQLSQDVWIKSTSVAWDRSVVAARGGTVKKKHPPSLIPPLSQHLWPAVKRAAFFFSFSPLLCCSVQTQEDSFNLRD